MDTSLPSSPSSSIGSPVSPPTPTTPVTPVTPTQRYTKREYNSPRYNPFFFGQNLPPKQQRVDPEVLKRPAVFSCQTTVRLSKSSPKSPAISAIRIPVITSCDFLCSCGCKKISSPTSPSGSPPPPMLQRKSSLVDSPLSFEDDEDDDEIINVDT